MRVTKALRIGAGMLALALVLAWFIIPMNEASARTLSSNETGTHGGYDYEYWKDIRKWNYDFKKMAVHLAVNGVILTTYYSVKAVNLTKPRHTSK